MKHIKLYEEFVNEASTVEVVYQGPIKKYQDGLFKARKENDGTYTVFITADRQIVDVPYSDVRLVGPKVNESEAGRPKVGDELIMTKNGKKGKVVKCGNDQCDVDFGNGDVYGIVYRRIIGNKITEQELNEANTAELEALGRDTVLIKNRKWNIDRSKLIALLKAAAKVKDIYYFDDADFVKGDKTIMTIKSDSTSLGDMIDTLKNKGII